jgi:sodium/potassium-transporting ATPase subunit alpha
MKEYAAMKIGDRPTVGDASESGIVKFFEPVTPIRELRAKQPVAVHNAQKAEIPFNSTNKYRLSIHEPHADNGKGHENDYMLCLKGAPEIIWERCTKIAIDGKEVELTADIKASIIEANLLLGKNGERVLAFSYRYLPVADFPNGYPFDPHAKNFPMDELTFSGLMAM